ncbi:hypothetical protein E2C01_038814 [Portunus trituberculatus]|uniref:Uncharacterized protein n=1 Tax=Portunus trituberculatus TaxID=210409 RepID=A0A5B7FBW8_PORTR|nr:hypothetical protein [Portunus trituberculatus]
MRLETIWTPKHAWFHCTTAAPLSLYIHTCSLPDGIRGKTSVCIERNGNETEAEVEAEEEEEVTEVEEGEEGDQKG